MECRQLCGHQIRVVTNVPVSRLDGDRELFWIVESRIEEGSLSAHLCVRNVRIPMRDRTPTGIGVVIHTGQTKGGRKQGGGGLAVGAKRLSIVHQLSVKLSRPPRQERLLQLIGADSQTVGERLRIGRQADDLSNVEITIGPPV